MRSIRLRFLENHNSHKLNARRCKRGLSIQLRILYKEEKC